MLTNNNNDNNNNNATDNNGNTTNHNANTSVNSNSTCYAVERLEAVAGWLPGILAMDRDSGNLVNPFMCVTNSWPACGRLPLASCL